MVVQAVAYLSLWLQAANGVKRFHVGLYQVAQDPHGKQQILFTWGIGPELISQDSIDVWFIDGHPKIAEVLQRLHNTRHVAHEVTNIGYMRKSAAICKPQWIGEVVQCYNGCHMPPLQIYQYCQVT